MSNRLRNQISGKVFTCCVLRSVDIDVVYVQESQTCDRLLKRYNYEPLHGIKILCHMRTTKTHGFCYAQSDQHRCCSLSRQ